MLTDKVAAKMGAYRISERALALIALTGGFAGIIAGGLFFHHKTSKPSFWVPIAVATIAWGVVLVAYADPRLLRF